MHPVDTLIIGAGPCGLAVAARLRENTPSAIFTDAEHQRYHWINRHKGKMSLVRRRAGKMRSLGVPLAGQKGAFASDLGDKDKKARAGSVSSDASTSSSTSDKTERLDIESTTSLSDNEADTKGNDLNSPSLLVLDSTAPTWLTKWHRAFSTLEIAQLRSPMFFHPDPSDRDGLLAYTTEQGREDDLYEIPGCVGKEVSKHKRKKQQQQKKNQRQGQDKRLGVLGDTQIDERDRKDYFSPGTGLFRDFCENVVGRYGLGEGVVREGLVEDIRFGYVDEVDDKVFTVTTSDGRVFYAKTVVLAVGPGGRKILPFELNEQESEGACHSGEIRSFPSPQVKKKIQQRKETNVVVVGGGLSSAQLVEMAVRKGVSKVWFLLRSDFKGEFSP